MGIDFTAVCDHELDWVELYTLPLALTRDCEVPLALRSFGGAPVYSDVVPWDWDRDRSFSSVQEELFETNHLTLAGPYGFGGTVFRRAIEITHLARWWSFLYERDIHVGLRHVAHAIARAVRARHVLFLPDSALPPAASTDALFEGASVEALLVSLKRHVGEPHPFPTQFVDKPVHEFAPDTWFYERSAPDSDPAVPLSGRG